MALNAIPLTIITGFLGSGKTTLINRLLGEAHDRRFAIIENEFGETGIDAELLMRQADESIVQLSNGCVCCSVRGDLANALSDLAVQRASGRIAFDHVLLETTGLADPGPLLRTFLAETAILEHYYLDGVVTLVDALNADKALSHCNEAKAQIVCSNRIFVTKIDQAPAAAVSAVSQRIHAMNIGADIELIDLLNSELASLSDRLLDIHGYQFDRIDSRNAAAGRRHEYSGSHDHHEHKYHADEVTAICWTVDDDIVADAFDGVLEWLRTKFPDLWRIKGVLSVNGNPRRVVVQGVQGLVQMQSTTYWRPFEAKRSSLVLIGKALDQEAITRALDDACVAFGAARVRA